MLDIKIKLMQSGDLINITGVSEFSILVDDFFELNTSYKINTACIYEINEDTIVLRFKYASGKYSLARILKKHIYLYKGELCIFDIFTYTYREPKDTLINYG